MTQETAVLRARRGRKRKGTLFVPATLAAYRQGRPCIVFQKGLLDFPILPQPELGAESALGFVLGAGAFRRRPIVQVRLIDGRTVLACAAMLEAE